MFNFFGAQLQAQSEQEQQIEVAPQRPKTPPKCYEEWITRQHGPDTHTQSSEGNDDYVQWPVLDPEHAMLVESDSDKGNILLGTLEEIKTDLKEHAPWDGVFLDNVDKRLQELEKTLGYLDDRFICERDPDSQESAAGGLKNISETTFLTELRDMDLLNSRNMHSNEAHLKSRLRNAQIQEEGDVMALNFPGFGSSTVVQLPGKLEALPILDLVTKAQHFPAHITRAWRKLFYSDASTTLFQNTFWWIWMDHFKPNSEQQALLFDTIADSFVTNLLNMDEKQKDEVFVHYPGCLSQALYCAFCKAFPKSSKYFGSPKFLSYISDLMCEWISGVKSVPNVWEKWPLKILNPDYSFNTENKPDTMSKTFSERDLLSQREQSSSNQQPSSRVQSSRVHLLRSSNGHQLERNRSALMSAKQGVNLAASAKGETDKKRSLSNMTVGPGPIYECVRFNTLGRSPLLQHYLVIHGLTEGDLVFETDVSRTQVKEIPPTTITYNELIRRTTEISEGKYKMYERKMAETGATINAVHKKHATDVRKMEKQNKRVLQHRHEVTILAEKLVANKRKAQLPPINKTPKE